MYISVWCRAAEEATAEAAVDIAVKETVGMMRVATEEEVEEATGAAAVVAAAGGRVAGKP
jgi:hypothetical protein